MIWQPRKKIITSRYHQRGNIVSPIIPGQDPLFGNVTLLMDCEETFNGAQVIAPTVGPTFTAFEADGAIAEVSDARFKFGAQSLFMDDLAGLDDAHWQTSAHFLGASMVAGDFTVEFHVYLAEANGTSRDMIGTWVGPNREWVYLINAQIEGDFRSTMQASTTGSNLFLGNQELWTVGNHPTGGMWGVWYHIAFTREGNNWFTHVDGFQVGSTRVNASTIFTGTEDFDIGGRSGPASEINIDNIRITKGAARYSPGDFSPPTEAYPAF